MTEVSEDRQLFREAADLAIRLQNDPANPVSIDILRRWVSRSPRHGAAWARVAAIHGMTGKILIEQGETVRVGASSLSRRTLLIGGVAGFGAATGGAIWLPGAIRRARADYLTSTAEIRRIALPDGSVTTLGPDSAIAIGYTDTHRRIELLAGMAYFDVAKAPARPFSVTSSDFTAIALGTAFDISSDAGFISVSVHHGSIETKGYGAEAYRSDEHLNAGDWASFDMSSRRIVRGRRETSQIAAWREGMIVAERESVAAMVAKIARWQPGKVVVADPFLGARAVSGVFDLADPARALEAVVRPFGAKVRKITPFLTLVSPV